MLRTLSSITLVLFITLIVVACEGDKQEVVADSGTKVSEISEKEISTTHPEVEIAPTPTSTQITKNSNTELGDDANRITLEGIAGISKRGATLRVGDDRYFLNDGDRWPPDLVGKVVRVEGTLRLLTIQENMKIDGELIPQMMGDGSPVELKLLENTRIIDE